MTSAHEGPMVLDEAAGFGCIPVIFVSFNAVRDLVVDNDNGLLVSAFDLDRHAERLAKLMSDEALRQRLAGRALEILGRFLEAHVGERWAQVFEGKTKRTCR